MEDAPGSAAEQLLIFSRSLLTARCMPAENYPPVSEIFMKPDLPGYMIRNRRVDTAQALLNARVALSGMHAGAARPFRIATG